MSAFVSNLSFGFVVAALTVGVGSTQAAVSGQGTWETTLQGRDLDGNVGNGFEAYYDTTQNLTWLTNPSNFTGFGSWAGSPNWVNVNGIKGWRLPRFVDTGAPGCNFGYDATDCGFNVDVNASELAHLFYVTLGNTSRYNRDGTAIPTAGGLSVGPAGFANTGPFQNIQLYRDNYTPSKGSFIEFANYAIKDDGDKFWGFLSLSGYQAPPSENQSVYAVYWPVHTGDVGLAVPEPSTWMMWCLGLLGLFSASRKPQC
jgi:PEP-CTERM motif